MRSQRLGHDLERRHLLLAVELLGRLGEVGRLDERRVAEAEIERVERTVLARLARPREGSRAVWDEALLVRRLLGIDEARVEQRRREIERRLRGRMERRAAVRVRLGGLGAVSRPRRFFSFDSPPPISEESDRSC